MDLHIIGATPTADERAAVDRLLGPPESVWAGGLERTAAETRASFSGLEQVRDRRDQLLPALHAVQDGIGWISHGALNYVCERLMVPPAEAWGVATFYHLLQTEPTPPVVVHVCDDIACRIRGATALYEQLTAQHAHTDRVVIHCSPCLGQCDYAPAVLSVHAGDPPAAHAIRHATVSEVSRHLTPNPSSSHPHHVAHAGATHRVLARVGQTDPLSLASYRTHGGYRALARAFEMGANEVVREVVASKLVGRGGAAFPTGRKWEAVARAPGQPHYLVCNADESEPGTFKDRVLLEEDPFALIESMTIAGFATACTRGYIYLRGEYPWAHAVLTRAIDQARREHLLGDNIMGRGVAFDIEIRRGAGAYICGEETALFNSIEGKRGEPRSKPPFPAEHGLFGKPTLVNNVETLVNVLDIVREGGANWARVGTPQSTGTRLFCLSGHVTRPGVYEAPFGITVGELLDQAGGVASGRSLQAILLGGAAGTFVGPESLSLKLTFEDVRAAGATMGSGVVMVFDDTVDLGDILLRIGQFMRDESCGQCVPCRVGTVRQVELIERLRAAASPGDLALLTELGQAMRDASICGLGQTASSAVETAVARLQVFHNGANA